MKKIVKQAFMMSDKFTVVCTNPPYMNKLEGQLKKFVVEEYNPYKGDLFSVFMHKNFDYCKPDGYSAFMTPFVWMFIKTYEQIREYIIGKKSITTLVQMEYSAFEEATVPICSFVLKNGKESEKGLFFKLSDFKGGMEVQKQKVLEALSNKECGYFYETASLNFTKIPNSPIAFSVNESTFSLFQDTFISTFGETREGMATANNDLFLRLWFEVDRNRIGLNYKDGEMTQKSTMKWFPYNKGGDFRKWYGNDEYVVNWENDGQAIMNFKDDKTGRIRSHNYNLDYIFQEGITWTALSSGNFGARYSKQGKLADSKGSMLYLHNTKNTNYALAFLNSAVSSHILKVTSQTLDFKPGRISELPMKIEDNFFEMITSLSRDAVTISKNDWDSFEVSWDFERHSLLNGPTMQSSYENWENECNNRFYQLKANEEELNRIFNNIYGLQGELTPEVGDKEVTVRRADLQRDIKSFISYAVGCMFGRYSLDVDGLAYAGGNWDDSIYSTVIPNADNCILITDEEYFGDDIVGLFTEFVKGVYGSETLEENLDFIAKALGNKGNNSREVIRNYFVKDFYKDHLKTYQKRPIYWLYDSGKQDGFKALVYMHRYSADTTGIVRVDYLHKMQKIYASEIDRMIDMTENSNNTREIAQAEKRKEKLVKQLKETKEYDEKIAHLAISRVAIDLDDGVKVNYEKVQTGQDGKKLVVLGKI